MIDVGQSKIVVSKKLNLWRRKAVCYLSNKHKLQIYSEMGQNWKLKRQKWSNGLFTILV